MSHGVLAKGLWKGRQQHRETWQLGNGLHNRTKLHIPIHSGSLMKTDTHLTSSYQSTRPGAPRNCFVWWRPALPCKETTPPFPEQGRLACPIPELNVFELFLLQWQVVTFCVKRKVTLPLWPPGFLCSHVEDTDMSSVCTQ